MFSYFFVHFSLVKDKKKNEKTRKTRVKGKDKFRKNIQCAGINRRIQECTGLNRRIQAPDNGDRPKKQKGKKYINEFFYSSLNKKSQRKKIFKS